MRQWFLTFIPWASLSAMCFGNPAQPALQTEGCLLTSPTWMSFRAGYVDDYLYRQRYKDEFKLDSLIDNPTFVTLSTHAAELTFNLYNRWDLYFLTGQSQLQVDQEVFTSWQFSWGIGTKIILFQHNSLRVGTDIKYFTSNQKPTYLNSENLPYNVLTDFSLQYQEMQASLGLSYQIQWLIPYLSATYLFSKIEPNPMIFLVRLPSTDFAADITSKSVITQRRWGLALGATILGNEQGSITLESRLLNQNGIDLSGEIRF